MMNEVEPHSPVIRFGVFEVDLKSAVLRRNGMKVRLQEKPFQMLVALLENPGDIVSREGLRDRLWGEVNVEYEHGLNIVANRLRKALGDSADNPKFVETVPRRGYRFIAALIAGHYTGSWALSVGVWQKWLKEDVEGAVDEAKKVQSILRANQRKDYLLARDATFLGYQFLSLGKVDAARALHLDYLARSINFPVILAFIEQDPELLNHQPSGQDSAITSFVRLDLEVCSRDRAEEQAKNEFDVGRRELILGKSALEAGRLDEAIPLLEESLRLLPGSSVFPVPELFLGSLALSEAKEAKSKLAEAIRVLERASTYRERCYPESSALWIVAQVRLARLYRNLGETGKAEDIESRVRLLLRHADPELPPMMRLED